MLLQVLLYWVGEFFCIILLCHSGLKVCEREGIPEVLEPPSIDQLRV